MVSQHQKPLNQITPNDIIDEALDYAKQFGLDAQRSDCSIEPIPPKPLEQEIGGGGSATRNPISSWTVIIRKNGRTALVPVEYALGGGLDAVNFKGW